MKSVHDNSRFKVYRGNGKETFECQICQKDFTKTGSKGMNFAMKFSTFNGLKNHFQILHKDSNFQACVCHVCYGSFRAHKLLRAHLKNVHNLNYGNISVPQNQAANDKIVESSKIKGHNDKFLESIEWGSNNVIRQIPPISIEECQKTNQLPQPGKQQQQAEKNQDLEKELNIQNHWQKEKQQHLENQEEIKKQTRHQWKKQQREWKKQLALKKQVQPENPQNIEKQQHIGFLLREQLQEQLQKQQHPKSVQKQTIESIEQHPSLLQKKLQEQSKKQQNNQRSVQKQPIDKIIEQELATLRDQPQEQVQIQQKPQRSLQRQPKQKQSIHQLQEELQKQQNHQKSVQKVPVDRTEQQSLLQKQLEEQPQKQRNHKKSVQKQPIDRIEQELAMLTQSESNVSFSDLSPLLQNIEFELQKNKDLQMLYDPRHGLSSLPCPKQLQQAKNKNSEQLNNESGVIVTNYEQQLNNIEKSQKQQKQTSIIKNHSLSRPICPSLLEQANKHNEQPNNEKGVIITNNDQLNEVERTKEQTEKVSTVENYQQQKQVQTSENRIVRETITVVEDMRSNHQNGAQAQKRTHNELEKIAKEAESFNCQYCGDSFNTTRSLIVHEKVMHRNVQPNNNHQNQEKLSQLQKLQEIAKEQNELMGKPPQTQPDEMQLQISRVLEGGHKGISENKKLESTKKDSNAVQKLRAFRKQKPRQSISKPSSTVEKVENPKLHSCLKCGETFEWGSDYLRHNRLVHIQAKINSLYSMLALEPVTWS